MCFKLNERRYFVESTTSYEMTRNIDVRFCLNVPLVCIFLFSMTSSCFAIVDKDNIGVFEEYTFLISSVQKHYRARSVVIVNQEADDVKSCK